MEIMEIIEVNPIDLQIQAYQTADLEKILEAYQALPKSSPISSTYAQLMTAASFLSFSNFKILIDKTSAAINAFLFGKKTQNQATLAEKNQELAPINPFPLLRLSHSQLIELIEKFAQEEELKFQLASHPDKTQDLKAQIEALGITTQERLQALNFKNKVYPGNIPYEKSGIALSFKSLLSVVKTSCSLLQSTFKKLWHNQELDQSETEALQTQKQKTNEDLKNKLHTFGLFQRSSADAKTGPAAVHTNAPS